MRSKIKALLVAILAVATLAGCVVTPGPRYYRPYHRPYYHPYYTTYYYYPHRYYY